MRSSRWPAGSPRGTSPSRSSLTGLDTFPRGVLWLRPAPSPALAELQRDAHDSLRAAGWPPAFGPRSAPERWIAHCTLATRSRGGCARSPAASGLRADPGPGRGAGRAARGRPRRRRPPAAHRVSALSSGPCSTGRCACSWRRARWRRRLSLVSEQRAVVQVLHALGLGRGRSQQHGVTVVDAGVGDDRARRVGDEPRGRADERAEQRLGPVEVVAARAELRVDPAQGADLGTGRGRVARAGRVGGRRFGAAGRWRAAETAGQRPRRRQHHDDVAAAAAALRPGRAVHFLAGASPVDSAAMKASCGTSTRPTIFIRFLPSFCFSSSLRLRVMSPP